MKSNRVLKAFLSPGLIIDYISMEFPELSLIETICFRDDIRAQDQWLHFLFTKLLPANNQTGGSSEA